jgi:hypothetical protein
MNERKREREQERERKRNKKEYRDFFQLCFFISSLCELNIHAFVCVEHLYNKVIEDEIQNSVKTRVKKYF